MNDFKFARDLYADLKESRLWPLALALAVGLIAVPVVLSRPAKESATPTTATATGTASAALTELRPIATVKTASTQTERKSVVRLARKNPFEPLVTTPSSSSGSSGSGTGTTAASGGSAAGTTGGTGTAGGTGSPETTTGTTGSTGTGSTGTGSTGEQSVFYYTFVAEVTFGVVGDTKRRKIQQMRALPSSDLPVVVFMGATADGDSAVFLVSNGAQVTGEGKCKPSDADCIFLYLKPGESASLAVGDATGALTTYDLELNDVEVKKLEQPPTASSSRGRSAHARAVQAKVERQQAKANKRHARARAKGFFQLFGRLGF